MAEFDRGSGDSVDGCDHDHDLDDLDDHVHDDESVTLHDERAAASGWIIDVDLLNPTRCHLDHPALVGQDPVDGPEHHPYDDNAPDQPSNDDNGALLQDGRGEAVLCSQVFDLQARAEEVDRSKIDQADKEEVMLSAERAAVVSRTKGFMPFDEGNALLRAAMAVEVAGPFLEVGSYCGKSSVYLGSAAEQRDTVLFSVDHHRGSDENQAGWEHHDTEVVDPATGRMDTLPFFRRTVEAAGLEDSVIALVGKSVQVARSWESPLALLFLDGGHGVEPARQDYELWTPFVRTGGLLAIHDVFSDPADGGRPPYEQIYLPALASGRFAEEAELNCGSLRILRRQ